MKRNNDRFNFFYALSLVFQLGFSIAIPLIFFLFVGVFIDKKFHSSPLFLIAFLIFSLFFLFFEVRYYLLPFIKKRPNNSRQGRDN